MSVRMIVDGFAAWLDLVAESVVAGLSRLRTGEPVQLVETDGAVFNLRRAGGADLRMPLDGAPAPALRSRDIDLLLQPRHFLYRPLELPKRAGEYLPGIVRSQIDRLTPWQPADAMFGWTVPEGAPDNRISLSVAATSRARIEPLLHVLETMGARSVRVFMQDPDGGAPIKVHEQAGSGALGVGHVRKALFATVAGLAVAAGVATLASDMLGSRFATELEEVEQQIGVQRRILAAARAQHDVPGVRELEQRKHQLTPTVLVLDALARALPDHSYATEVSIAEGKLDVLGISGDPPALIAMLEKVHGFSRASFAAPTTQVEDGAGERFHIQIDLANGAGAAQ
jgi:general secretion pathway protein L